VARVHAMGWGLQTRHGMLSKRLMRLFGAVLFVWLALAACKPDSAHALLAASRMGVLVSAGIGTVSKSEQ
jgi:hypothetical protein